MTKEENDSMKVFVFASLLTALAVGTFGFPHESLTEVWDRASAPNVTFIVYTRDKSGSKIILGDTNSIQKSGFNAKLPVFVLTHGYQSSEKMGSVLSLRKAILAKHDANVIAVDWSSYTKNILYDKVVRSVKPVGLHVSSFLRFLTSATGLQARSLHFIGHSLGAHVASFASNAFNNEKIGRITGLDPAAPLMENLPSEDRLDPKDAAFVDVIHTCTTIVGIRRPIGTVDFYPNGGQGQPQCQKIDLSCSHKMSYKFLSKAIQTGVDFKANKCNSLQEAEKKRCAGESAPLGLGAVKAKPGIYYLKIDKI